jgi:predicted hotdog family 3-hydroxylacyl-ACP dehydratase
MDLVSFFAALILYTTLGTLAVAVAAYAAYKLREGRRPRRGTVADTGETFEPIFLERFEPGQALSTAVSNAGAKRGG